MKIDFSQGLGFYSNIKPGGHYKDTRPHTAGKTDVAEFSRGTHSALDKALLSAKTAIQGGVGANAHTERLEALRQNIKNGDYHVPSREIVAAILGYGE